MVDTIHQLIISYEQATKSHEIWSLFLNYIKERGFSWATYSYQFTPVPNKVQTKSKHFEHFKNDYIGLTWLTSLPLNASQEYLDRKYDRIDPVLHHVKKSLHPLHIGREFLDPKNPSYKECNKLYKRGEYFGFKTGYCIPLRHPCGRSHGSITLHCRDGKSQYLKYLQNYGPQLQLAALYMHSFFQPLERKERIGEIGINGRRYMILADVCAGKSNKEIATEQSISEPTVSFHINKLKRQLNATNTRELVTAATQLGFFEE